MKKAINFALIITGVVLLLGVIGFITWGMTPLGPTHEALAAMESNANVTVQDNGNFVVFTPTLSTPTSGFIFYPGGHVDYRSYAPIAQEIASRGYQVSVVRMPLSLAFFGINKADEVIAAYPDMRYWVIGGHSLGGSMAASYAKKHPVNVQGLALWASYPVTSDDLSSTDMKGLSTYGSNDQVMDRENFYATLGVLPPGTMVQVIQGGNHAQFGNYGLQPGDGTATISTADQQIQAADLTVRLLRAVEGE
ncbi:MAG: alpha/beta hydrolase [Methanoregulaceae archaeon]|nr:alpha/beta hydrolase [Methanoregulaceae archaeon]